MLHQACDHGTKISGRIADKVLRASLEASGAVLIEGPKWCGKTRTAEEMAASTLYMQDSDHTGATSRSPA